jgi:hypothetical protein
MGPGDERRDDTGMLGVIPVLVTGIHLAAGADRRAVRIIAL